MISEYENYHGVVLRSIIVESPSEISIDKFDQFGRLDAFILNYATGVYIKYSSKRLSPWAFSFTLEQMHELEKLTLRTQGSAWIAFVCGQDGVACIEVGEFASVTEANAGGVASLRITRQRNALYRVSGNSGTLGRAIPKGVDKIVHAAFRK